MNLVIITAIGVGGATVVGALIGFLFKVISHKFSDVVLGFAAGIMLAASMIGLIIPSIESGGKHGIWISVLGILIGALFLDFADKITPHLHRLTGMDREKHSSNAKINKVMLFVLAIAIHNLPEGMAAGVGFGSDNISSAMIVAIGIALQNIPEGMVIISPMLLSGVSKKRTLVIASLTGVIEVVGTFIGYFLADISGTVLPFLLAFAGGTMLYIISDEMIPETHSHGFEKYATYSLLVGFIVMLIMDFYIS
ncbi:ZIP family metal transporter [Anaerofustis stercorihominis]|uniref:Metal cation transporter, ZIP family n=2 Tax=Anaerofustis stercorihominis TaxID=214853 RepID=B1C6Q0_9FIRM|nr:ZIP family metal transporter [Anaerofustis stercorihominis]EDS72687.1 metal cation transporter, ZIP family [Anaerofustis stercorihominis DSM 17244]MCQ4794062.1 ZIP family metal transporter [Anaerofustis stercorihominis]